MRPRCAALLAFALALLAPSAAAAAPADFGLESLEASLSTTQAGDHPDFTFTFEVKQNPESKPNVFGLHDAYATTRNVRFDMPPGLVGDPSVLGPPQQCTVAEFTTFNKPGGGCPNGSQIGVATVYAYDLTLALAEPVYMMAPPGGDVVARVGFIAGAYATFADIRVRSESDYGLVTEIIDAPTLARLVKAETTLWGVPAAPIHNTQRCTPDEAVSGCVISPSRPPGSRPLPFLTNPTRCGVPLSFTVSAASWVEPDRFDAKSVAFPLISGCEKLPFGPSLTIEPTNRRAGALSGLDAIVRSPASDGVNVLEPSQVRDIKVTLPEGLAVNTGVASGLATCSEDQVHFGERVAAQCPDAAKVADFEADIPALPRRLNGAIYLREPEPGNPFRIWAVADDLGAHVKLQGQLNIDKQTGQIESAFLDTPQAPLREVKLGFKSGFRAPLVNPLACGEYHTEYEFTPWSGEPPVKSISPIGIDEGCDGLGAFNPKLSAGTTDPTAGRHAPFLFTLTREDGEQNPQGLDITLPPGLAATFAGVERCEGAVAETGACPAGSRIGKVAAAVGTGQFPLWVPEEGKRPTAIYLSGPYKGAPLSIVAVVPRQAGPFDFGDEVVRSAIYVDPNTARATAKTDPLPQLIEGIPIRYRTVNVQLDRQGFSLNPTSCAEKATEATVTSSKGAIAHPASPFRVVNCANLGFKPALSLRLVGSTHRGAHPKLRAVVRPRPGDTNIAASSVALPHSEFLDQSHIGTVCTRVQFSAKQCPARSIYGEVEAKTPLFDEPLKGPLYLRSSNHPLPDLVAALRGPDSLPIEIALVGRVDSINGGIRTTFDVVPDAPVSEAVFRLEGGVKGLLVNSTNLCAKINRATAKFRGQNGKQITLHPAMQASCPAHGKKKRVR